MNDKEPRVIKSLSEYLEWTEELKAGQYLFRGLPNKGWNILPSTYLRLKKYHRNAAMLIKLNKELLEDARRLGYDERDGKILSDLELLADLQHRGAATCLIDFTNSAFVALWFACQTNSEGEADGKVFAVRFKDPAVFKSVTTAKSTKGKLEEFFKGFKGDERSEFPSSSKPSLHQWQPKPVNHSIIAQKAAFIFGYPEVSAEHVCVIDQSSKSKILESLNKSSSINEATLFPGLDNFARMHSYDREYSDPDLQDDLQRGIDAHMEGNLDDAIAYYMEVISIEPEDTSSLLSAYFNRGWAYFDKSDFDAAIRDFDKVIELDPNDADAYDIRGRTYAEKGDLDAAIRDFDKVIELDPNNGIGYNNRGVSYSRKGALGAAIRDYTKAIELDRNNANAYNNRGYAYSRKGALDAAIRDYTKAIELDPKNAVPYCNRGEAWLHKEKWDKARADLTTAKDMGADIIASFHNDYKRVADFEQKTGIKLPTNIAAMLTDGGNEHNGARSLLRRPQG